MTVLRASTGAARGDTPIGSALPRPLSAEHRERDLLMQGDRGAGNKVSIDEAAGFLVADVQGRLVGCVECPMYGSAPNKPDALAVRSRMLGRRRFIVPTASIEAIDPGSRVIGLGLERDELQRFL
jgi:hypothetical protein